MRSKLEGRQQAHKIAKEAALKVEAEDVSDVGLACEPIYVECDVASRASVDAAVAAVAEQLGAIDVLINNGARHSKRRGLMCPLTKELLRSRHQRAASFGRSCWQGAFESPLALL